MWGGLFGLFVGSLFSYFGEISWWWLFAWGIGGVLMELGIRVGAGEEVADAMGNIASIGIDLSDIGDIGGGDSGGGGGGD